MKRIASITVASVFVLTAQAALALPRPASGSNCSSDWVNNAGAMACFIKGEDERNAGVAHPHYVACLNGDIFCCVDTDRGQDCEAQTRANRASPADWMRAVLAAQRARAMEMRGISKPAVPTTGTMHKTTP
jgi:hypothetical protein